MNASQPARKNIPIANTLKKNIRKGFMRESAQISAINLQGQRADAIFAR